MEDVENMNLLRQASLKTKYGLSFKEQVSRPPHLLFGHCGLAHSLQDFTRPAFIC